MSDCFDERWLKPGGIVPVDPVTTGLLVQEIQRLRAELDGRACWPGTEPSWWQDFIRDLRKWNAAPQATAAGPEANTRGDKPAVAAQILANRIEANLYDHTQYRELCMMHEAFEAHELQLIVAALRAYDPNELP